MQSDLRRYQNSIIPDFLKQSVDKKLESINETQSIQPKFGEYCSSVIDSINQMEEDRQIYLKECKKREQICMHNNSQIEGARNKSSIQSLDRFVEGSSVIGEDHANQNSKGRNFSEK